MTASSIEIVRINENAINPAIPVSHGPFASDHVTCDQYMAPAKAFIDAGRTDAPQLLQSDTGKLYLKFGSPLYNLCEITNVMNFSRAPGALARIAGMANQSLQGNALPRANFHEARSAMEDRAAARPRGSVWLMMHS